MNKELIESELKIGKGPALIAKELNLPYGDVYRFARSIGFNRTWRRGQFVKNSLKGVHKNLKISVDTILAMYDNGEKQIEIAKVAGCSREYIRQLINSSGRIPAREKRKKTEEMMKEIVEQNKILKNKLKEEIKLKRKLLKKEKDELKWGKAVKMWNDGKSLAEICQEYDIKDSSLSWYIGKLRKEYGWFERRTRDKNIFKDKMKIADQLWSEGKSISEIAKYYNINRNTMCWNISHARKKYGMFPKRQKIENDDQFNLLDHYHFNSEVQPQ